MTLETKLKVLTMTMMLLVTRVTDQLPFNIMLISEKIYRVTTVIDLKQSARGPRRTLKITATRSGNSPSTPS